VILVDVKLGAADGSTGGSPTRTDASEHTRYHNRVIALPDTFNAATWFVDRNVQDGRGAKVAIECGDERVTYAQLLERVNRAGNVLRDRYKVRIEERILLLLLDGPEFIYTFFGAIKIGAVPIPTSTLWKPSDYEYVLNDSRARLAVVSETLLPQLQAIPRERLRYLQHVITVGSAGANEPALAELLATASPELEAEPTSKDDPAFWLYSSGSTGFPKGCVHLQHDMVVCTELYGRGILRMTADDRCFSVAKLFFAYGLGNAMYCPLGVGATTILWPGSPAAANVYAVIEKHRPTLFFSVPTNYGMLLAHTREGRDFDLSSIRYGVSAGEALPPALFERFKARFGIEILDGIGSTEILHIFISNRPGDIRPGSSGRLLDGYRARIVDEENRDVAVGEIGNLLISGDSTCACYWNKHEKTKATIEGEWIRTGDKYYQDAEGYYWYAGRSDDMMKVGGIWVSPVEVENALIEHPAVQECGIGSRADRDGLIKPYAFVVVRQEVGQTPELAAELQQFVRSRLAEYKRPRWVEFIAELPKTATGKLQRYKLRERAAAATLDEHGSKVQLT
jgi:benzoate-CoA ligase family protein